MTVFKAYLKVLDKCKVPIIIYTVCLIFFGAFSLESNREQMNFTKVKPDIYIINHDESGTLTKNLISYLEENTNIKTLNEKNITIEDALFYRDISYVVEIPKGFTEDFLKNRQPKLEVKSVGDYEASLTEELLERYMNTANIYLTYFNEEELLEKISHTLKEEVEVEMTSTLDSDSLSEIATFYNFANYALLGGCIYVICLILSSFQKDLVKKRTIISSLPLKQYNRSLFIANSLFAIVLWLVYVLLSIVMLGNSIFEIHGVFFILNSFLFTLVCLTLSFLLSSLIDNKEAINGVVNVIALGSSFLCGSFVPMSVLPKSVLQIARVLPSYWYIHTNEYLKTLEVVNFSSCKQILFNSSVLVLFALLFIFLNHEVTKRKQRIK